MTFLFCLDWVLHYLYCGFWLLTGDGWSITILVLHYKSDFQGWIFHVFWNEFGHHCHHQVFVSLCLETDESHEWWFDCSNHHFDFIYDFISFDFDQIFGTWKTSVEYHYMHWYSFTFLWRFGKPICTWIDGHSFWLFEQCGPHDSHFHQTKTKWSFWCSTSTIDTKTQFAQKPGKFGLESGHYC